MQASKVVCLALFACLVFVNTEATTLGFRNENNINNALDIEKHLIEEIIESHEQIIKDIIENASKNLHDELANALEEISKIADDVNKVLEYLQTKNGNIKDCVEKYLPDIIALVQKTQETQNACIKDILGEIEDIKNKLKEDLAGEREKVKEVIAAIQQCTSKDCYKENGNKLIELVGEVRGKVRKVIDEVVGVIQGASPAAVECLKDASDEFEAEAKKIMGDAIACING